MPDKRKAYAPFSLITESGVSNAPVEGYIDVNQEIQPTVSTGTVNENGVWTGVKSDDKEFIAFTKAVEVPDGASVLFPDTNEFPSLDMSGFQDFFIAIKPSRGGNCAMEAVMGPDTERFANLSPIVPAAGLRGNIDPRSASCDGLFSDSAELMQPDAWNIFYIGVGRLAGQRHMQMNITNNSGGASTIEVAFMRLI